MKNFISSRGLLAIGFVILVATNILVLSGVASNRTGSPESQVTLTEREIQLPYRVYKENSGLNLRLAWRTLGKNKDSQKNLDWRTPVWFNSKKLEELGFDMSKYLKSNGNEVSSPSPIPKEVYIVLENNGEPYMEALRRAERALKKAKELAGLNTGDKGLRNNFERAEKRLNRERQTESRLFVIDAGLDPRKLREKYDDRTRFFITKGVVKPTYTYENKIKTVTGIVIKLSIESVHVPLKYRQVFDAILVADNSIHNEYRRPRYSVTLANGTRFEPWIVSVQHMGE